MQLMVCYRLEFERKKSEERGFRMSLSKKALYLILGLVFVFAVAAGGAEKSFAQNGNGKITFADFSWESVQVHNRIAGFLIRHGWGREVEYMLVEEVPGFMGLERGDIQIAMEAWVDNAASYWEEAIKRGMIISLGKNYPDAPQGWYVPTYIIEGDEERGIEPMAPDLKSVSDLPKYWELFKDPELKTKGRFNNGPSGWIISVINEKRLKAYGLDKTYRNFYTGSAAALASAIAGAYERGNPVLAYYWEPTPLLGMYDMTRLEEPPYDEKVWNDTGACEMPKCRVLKVANRDFLEENPEIEEMLKRYRTSLELTNEVLAYMKKNAVAPEDAAEWFLKSHPKLWRSWIADPKVQEKIARSLEQI